MKIVAAVFADFEHTFLGGPSQLLTPLVGQTVLARTLARLLRVEGLDGRCLLVRARDRARATAAVAELQMNGRIDVLPLDDGLRPRRELLRSARKWALESWRGSPLGTTWFDEYVEPRCAARLLDHYAGEALLCLDGHMPVLDPAIATDMLAQQRRCANEARLVFTPAPPGLAGVILRRDLIRELLEQDIPLGLLLSYRPEIPRVDPINQPSCVQVDPCVAHTQARLTADTRHSRERLSAALAELGDDIGAGRLCSWFQAGRQDRLEPLPREVELELTTDDPLPETTLRLRGARIPARRLSDLAAVERLATELAAWDDCCVFLGGHGDPLAHPQFAEICARLRSSGVCGLGLATPLVELSDRNLEALLAAKVDVIQVRLDADTAETYRQVQRADAFERVCANVERIAQARRERLSPQPLILCSLTRCAATLAEVERFYDRWIRATGWAVIEGYNEHAGALAADTLLHAGPNLREPCRRLNRRMMLLADGTSVLCGQDAHGVHPVGSWLSEPITAIWHGDALHSARRAHASLNLVDLPLCARCREWFRP